MCLLKAIEVLYAYCLGLQPALATSSAVLLSHRAPCSGNAGDKSLACRHTPCRRDLSVEAEGWRSAQQTAASSTQTSPTPKGFAFARRESWVGAELSCLGPNVPFSRN